MVRLKSCYWVREGGIAVITGIEQKKKMDRLLNQMPLKVDHPKPLCSQFVLSLQ